MSIISPAAFATESSPDEASKAEVTIPMQPDVEEPLANTIGDLSPEELATAKLEAKDIPEIIYSKDVEEEGHVNRLRAQEPDLCSVIFQNRDGTKSLYSFTYPVKYKDENGVVQDKSTELTATTDKKGYGFVNAKNDIKTWYPDSLQLDRGMALEADGIAVELSPISATENKKETARKAVSALAQKVRVSDEKGSSGDAVEYAGVFGDNTSIRYSSTFEGFKEDIIFEANMGINRFSFKLKTGGLSLIKDEDGQYCLTDPSTGECKVSIGELVVTDSRPVPDFKTKYNHFYEVQTVEPDNEYIITAVVDEEYLNSPDTVYPVTVDPTLTVRQTSGSQSRVANDATLYSKQPNLKTGSFNNLWVGNDSGGLNSQGTNYGKERILIKFPTLVSALQSAGITNNMITEARLYMFLSSSATPAATIDAYMFGHSWSESSVTYNNADWNDYTSYQDSTRIQSSSYDYWWWGITGAVKKWRAGQYGGSSNYGLIMISQDESVANKDHSFYSSNYTTISKRPYVKVTYNNASPGVPTPGITSGQVYYLRNANSGKYLDVPKGNSGNGTDLIQYSFNGGANQIFKTVYNSTTGDYALIPMCATGSAVEITNTSPNNNEIVQIWSKPSSGYMNSQRFKIVRNSNGSYKLLSYASSYTKAVVVQGASTANSAKIIQYNDNGATNGNWYFESVESFNYNSTNYNVSLAEECAEYAMLAYDEMELSGGYYVQGDRKDKPYQLLSKLREDGFTVSNNDAVNYQNNKDYDVSYVLARKSVLVNNSLRTLVAVVIRGTDGVEWQGNMDVTGSSYDTFDNHINFATAVAALSVDLDIYLSNKNISDPIYLITGHSRGAAVANLLAEKLNTTAGISNVFAYTFATPNVTKAPNSSRTNIYNFCFKDDFVPQVPLGQEHSWKYDKHGITYDDKVAETLYANNASFRNDMKRFLDGRDAEFNPSGTSNLLDHVSDKWEDVEEYYNNDCYTGPTIPGTPIPITPALALLPINRMTLYEFFHNEVALAATGDPLASVLVLGRSLNSNYFFTPIAVFFVQGQAIYNYIPDTHHAFTYYTAVKYGLFP